MRVRPLTKTHEAVTAVSTGSAPVALGMIQALITRLGYELDLWVLWSGGILACLMLAICFATTTHLVWASLWGRRSKAAVASARGTYGKAVVGGRAEDEPGVTIGPMPMAEALELWKTPEPEFIPLDEAARWLYNNAAPWLR
ncbi:MAG: hypothetical protein JWQ97_2073, partial [Phenylobacterium sp.]|nr:hypothetical protein [Phenylobacterium sp.]